MRVVYMGKNKRSVLAGLEYLIDRDIEVAAVVAPKAEAPAEISLAASARRHGIPVRTDTELYAILDGDTDPEVSLDDVDLVLSFLFWNRIRVPLITLPRIGCINFHPAPLPDFRGLGGYNVAILEGLSSWGVSAHFVEERFDTGPVIEVRRFEIDRDTETAWSLDRRSQQHLLELFCGVIDRALEDGRLEGTPQGPGRYVNREEFEGLRRVLPDDGPEVIDRKIRAFWYPPYRGATLERDGQVYTLITDRLLNEIAERYQP